MICPTTVRDRLVLWEGEALLNDQHERLYFSREMQHLDENQRIVS